MIKLKKVKEQINLVRKLFEKLKSEEDTEIDELDKLKDSECIEVIRLYLADFLESKNLFSDFYSRVSVRFSIKLTKVPKYEYTDHYTCYFDDEIFSYDKDIENEEIFSKREVKRIISKPKYVDIIKLVNLLIKEYGIDKCELCEYCKNQYESNSSKHQDVCGEDSGRITDMVYSYKIAHYVNYDSTLRDHFG